MSEVYKNFMDYAFLKNLYHKDWHRVARVAGVCVGDVIALWSAIMNYTDCHDDNLNGFDHEAIDALYGYRPGLCLKVIRALQERGFIKDGIVDKYWQ